MLVNWESQIKNSFNPLLSLRFLSEHGIEVPIPNFQSSSEFKIYIMYVRARTFYFQSSSEFKWLQNPYVVSVLDRFQSSSEFKLVKKKRYLTLASPFQSSSEFKNNLA